MRIPLALPAAPPTDDLRAAARHRADIVEAEKAVEGLAQRDPGGRPRSRHQSIHEDDLVASCVRRKGTV